MEMFPLFSVVSRFRAEQRENVPLMSTKPYFSPILRHFIGSFSMYFETTPIGERVNRRFSRSFDSNGQAGIGCAGCGIQSSEPRDH